MINLFTYGSLMFEPVWRSVVGKTFRTERGDLRGYAVFRVRDAAYPGIIRAGDEDTAPGTIYFSVDSRVIQRLDRFEGACYSRESVAVAARTGETIPCDTYVVKPAYVHILECEKWSSEWFEQHELDSFLATHV